MIVQIGELGLGRDVALEHTPTSRSLPALVEPLNELSTAAYELCVLRVALRERRSRWCLVTLAEEITGHIAMASAELERVHTGRIG